MTKRFWRILTGVIFVFAVCYASFQIYRKIYSPYKTESVYTYSVTDIYRGQAVILRDEQVVASQNTGVLHYVYEDGSRILAGKPIAQIFKSADDISKLNRTDELSREIESLKNIQQTAGKSYTSPDTMVGKITGQLGVISDITSDGVLNSISDYRTKLLDLLNQRQISTGKESDFSQRISYLQNELDYAKKDVQGSLASITAPSTGYFAGSVDGFETKLSAKNIDTISVADLESAAAGQLVPDSINGMARIVLSQNWYLAIPVDSECTAKFYEGLVVTLDFNLEGLHHVPATVYRIRENESNKTDNKKMVILKCNYVTPELISLRTTALSILLHSYSGYKVNSEAVRYVDGKKGVYVLEGKQIVFRPIVTLYEESSFVICNAADEANSLRLFDQVIVGGTDLYDGKYIN